MKYIVKLLDFNNNITEIDILDYVRRVEEGRKPRFRIKTKEDLKRTLMAQYWSRCEYEWLVYPWEGGETDDSKFKKTDVYQWAIEPNLDVIWELCVKEKIIKPEK